MAGLRIIGVLGVLGGQGGAPGDGSITTDKLADNAVTNVKMADNAIDTLELADDAVTTSKILNLAVNSLKLGNAQVSGIKLDATLSSRIRRTDTLTSDTEGDTAADVIRFTANILGANGANINSPTLIHAWVSDTERGAAVAIGTLAAGTKGTLIVDMLANAAAVFVTDAAGDLEIDVTVAGAATKWLNVSVQSTVESLVKTWNA
ncbi:hypothetical protein LCGC14_0583800 [marine sediment metagenome]|uniref:Uncharacterized protein n=1 Tax=marine sediment metagenome TaxID=412755 RepID=A0A0F9RKM5_9ZZZZ